MSEEPFLTVQEAAIDSGLTEGAIRNAMTRGRLPFTIMYGRKLISREDFAAYREVAHKGRPKKDRA